MTLVSFPAAAADPSVIGSDDPAAGGESSLRADGAGDDAVVPGLDPDHPTADGNLAAEDVEGAAPTSAAPTSAAPTAAAPTGPIAAEPSPPLAASLTDDVVAVARAAAVEEAGRADQVGEYLGAVHEDDVAVAAAFAATDRGYLGWYWSVTLALVEPERQTISEVVLLPGERALLAPPWVPWDQRIRAGDVGTGDLLPTAADDIRLVPGYLDSDDPAIKEVEYEFGFGRPRVLSREGRDDAAQRWHDGPFGPDDAVAQAAPANCVTCGFFTPLAGLLGMTLGACANEYSPADGRVVDAEYGCGAHSQTVIDAPLISASTETVVDELTLEVHLRPARAVAAPSEVVVDEVVADEALTGVIDGEPDTDPDAVLDPAPDAEADLLQDLAIDPALESVLIESPAVQEVSEPGAPSWNDQGQAELWDQSVDVAWPTADRPDEGN